MGDYTVEIGKEEESLAFILSSEVNNFSNSGRNAFCASFSCSYIYIPTPTIFDNELFILMLKLNF